MNKPKAVTPSSRFVSIVSEAVTWLVVLMLGIGGVLIYLVATSLHL